MGIMKEIRCPSCHRDWKAAVGHGRMHGKLDRAVEAFPEELQRKIRMDAGLGDEPLFLFNYRLAVCPECKDIVAVPFLRFLETGWEYVSPCPKCGGKAEVLEEDIPGICPNCQKAGLEAEETGHWD